MSDLNQILLTNAQRTLKNGINRDVEHPLPPRVDNANTVDVTQFENKHGTVYTNPKFKEHVPPVPKGHVRMYPKFSIRNPHANLFRPDGQDKKNVKWRPISGLIRDPDLNSDMNCSYKRNRNIAIDDVSRYTYAPQRPPALVVKPTVLQGMFGRILPTLDEMNKPKYLPGLGKLSSELVSRNPGSSALPVDRPHEYRSYVTSDPITLFSNINIRNYLLRAASFFSGNDLFRLNKKRRIFSKTGNHLSSRLQQMLSTVNNVETRKPGTDKDRFIDRFLKRRSSVQKKELRFNNPFKDTFKKILPFEIYNRGIRTSQRTYRQQQHYVPVQRYHQDLVYDPSATRIKTNVNRNVRTSTPHALSMPYEDTGVVVKTKKILNTDLNTRCYTRSNYNKRIEGELPQLRPNY